MAGSCCGIDSGSGWGEDVAAGVEAGLAIPRYSVQILKSEATQDYRTESALFSCFSSYEQMSLTVSL